jgi:hypothetical protein
MAPIDIVIEDSEKKKRTQQMMQLIENAKWKMHAEEWTDAASDLNKAKEIAVTLRDKNTIDQIFSLLNDCRNKAKPKI